MADEKLVDIVIRAGRGEYDLPETQRSFVWKPEQVRMLCDSLYQDYPIGMLLLWDNPNYIQPRIGDPNNTRQPRWILDGQQRITTLGLLFGQKPYWYGPREWTDLRNGNSIFINVDLSSQTVQFSRRPLGTGWKSISVPDILSKEDVTAVTNLADQMSEGDPGINHRIIGPLLKLWNVRNAQIPVIQLSGRDPEEAEIIFERFNRAGTRVKDTDTRLATIAAYNPGFVRNQIDPFLSELEDKGWDIQPGYLLQAMAVFRFGKARTSEVDRTFWQTGVPETWAKVREAVDEVSTFLWDRGIPTIDLIPSEYTLIPLFAIHAKFKGTSHYVFDDAYRWFLLANMEGRYSGAPLQYLSKDATSIHEKPTLEQALNEMPPLERPTVDQFVNLFQEPFRKNSFPSLLIHLLLWQNNAHDWLQPLTIQAARTNNGSFQPHWHHILPKGWAKRNSFEGADLAANITILTNSTNVRSLGSRSPWEYVPRNNISQQALEEHFIPEDFARKLVSGSQLTNEEFNEFLKKRSELLAAKAMQYLGLT